MRNSCSAVSLAAALAAACLHSAEPCRSCPTSTRSGSTSRSRRTAQRSHLRREGRRPAGLDRHRGRPGVLDKRTGKIKSWKEKDGLPWRVVTAIDVDHKDRRRLARAVRRRPGALQRRPLRPLAPAQQRPGQRRRLRRRDRERQRLGRHHRRRQPLQHRDRRVDHLHREERADGGDLELRRRLRRRQGLPGRVGQRRAGVRRGRPDRWKDYLDPDGEMEIDLYRDDGIVHVITTGGQLRRTTCSGSPPTSARAATTAATGAASTPRTPACPATSPTTSRRRSADEAWFCHRQGRWASSPISPPTPGSPTRATPKAQRGKAVVTARQGRARRHVEMPVGMPHNFIIASTSTATMSGSAPSKGLGWGIGEGYYPGLKETAQDAHVGPAVGNRRCAMRSAWLAAAALSPRSAIGAQSKPDRKLATEDRAAGTPR